MDMYGVRSRSTLQMDKDAYFTSEIDAGNSGAAITINWTLGNKQKLTLTGAPGCTLTFNNPTGCTTLTFKLVQGVGGSKTAVWPGTVKWSGGVAPTLSIVAGAIDLVGLYWDGTSYYGVASLAFA